MKGRNQSDVGFSEKKKEEKKKRFTKFTGVPICLYGLIYPYTEGVLIASAWNWRETLAWTDFAAKTVPFGECVLSSKLDRARFVNS